MTRTYSADDWARSRNAWASFNDPLWDRARELAQSWTIFPPSQEGDEYVNSEHPSQRVIIWFALVERPVETAEFIRRSSSWFDVVKRISESRSALRRAADWDEETAELERRYDRETYRGAMATVGKLLTRWKDSL